RHLPHGIDVALNDAPLYELVVTVRPTEAALALSWLLLDHGPYPGPPPHPFEQEPEPVVRDGGREPIEIDLATAFEVARRPDVASALFGAASPAAAALRTHRPARVSLDLGPLWEAPIWWDEIVERVFGLKAVPIVR